MHQIRDGIKMKVIVVSLFDSLTFPSVKIHVQKHYIIYYCDLGPKSEKLF